MSHSISSEVLKKRAPSTTTTKSPVRAITDRRSHGTTLAIGNYITLKNVLSALLLSLVIFEFYLPASNQLAEAKKSKKYVVVKEIGTTYKKVPVYKKVPMKVLKVVIKKKKMEKPWKKWFKKEMIVKIPKEKKHHHHYHHAASEGHETWALPAFISAPSSMSEIFEAWPNDYTNGNNNNNNNNNGAGVAKPSVTNSIGDTIKHSQQQTVLPTSVHDLKSVGSEEYPAILADAAVQLVQHHLNGYPPFSFDSSQQHDSRLFSDSIDSLAHLTLGSSQTNDQQAAGIQSAVATPVVGAASAPVPTTTSDTATTSSKTGSLDAGGHQSGAPTPAIIQTST